MRRNWIVAAIIAIALMAPSLTWAHDGPHKIIGTVTSVRGNQVEVRTTAGKKETVVMSANTPVTRGDRRAAVADVKVGERVSIDCLEQKSVMMAQAVKLGTAPAPASR